MGKIIKKLQALLLAWSRRSSIVAEGRRILKLHPLNREASSRKMLGKFPPVPPRVCVIILMGGEKACSVQWRLKAVEVIN